MCIAEAVIPPFFSPSQNRSIGGTRGAIATSWWVQYYDTNITMSIPTNSHTSCTSPQILWLWCIGSDACPTLAVAMFHSDRDPTRVALHTSKRSRPMPHFVSIFKLCLNFCMSCWKRSWNQLRKLSRTLQSHDVPLKLLQNVTNVPSCGKRLAVVRNCCPNCKRPTW